MCEPQESTHGSSILRDLSWFEQDLFAKDTPRRRGQGLGEVSDTTMLYVRGTKQDLSKIWRKLHGCKNTNMRRT